MSQLLSTERPSNLLPSPRPVDTFCPAALAVISAKRHHTQINRPSDCRLIPWLSGLAVEHCSRKSKHTKGPYILQCETSLNPFRRLRLLGGTFNAKLTFPLFAPPRCHTETSASLTTAAVLRAARSPFSVLLRAARSPFSVLLRAARSPFSVGLPGPYSP